MTEPATFRNSDGVVVITMDDGKANAMSLAMQQSIHRGLDAAQAESTPVVLEGRPGVFSGGFDLKTLASGGQPAVDMLRGGMDLALRLLEFPTPVVAASTGHAMAMGIFILTSCDYRIGVGGQYRYRLSDVIVALEKLSIAKTEGGLAS